MVKKRSRFGVILADPPWNYNNTGVEGSAAGQYQTMTDNEIASLPVAKIAADDSVLLLWATWPKLDVAIQIVNEWGFRYVTGFPWIKIESLGRSLFDDQIEIKPFYGVGFWVRGCSEPILIGRRGSPERPNFDYYGLLSPNLYHSRKPDDLYEYAESLNGPYLEMFARRKRTNWSSWGNEIESDLEL